MTLANAPLWLYTGISLAILLATAVVALWWVDLHWPPAWCQRPPMRRAGLTRQWLARWMPRLLCGLMIWLSAWALYGCGTVPLRASTRQQVPAELLVPPSPPVLLTPGLGLKPPGTTTPSTPKPARSTGYATSA